MIVKPPANLSTSLIQSGYFSNCQKRWTVYHQLFREFFCTKRRPPPTVPRPKPWKV